MIRIRVVPPGCGSPASHVATDMTATTPSKTRLCDSYDRVCRRREEQIRSGMLLCTLEVPDRWYERGNVRATVGESVTPAMFQNERLGAVLRAGLGGLEELEPASHGLRLKIEVRPVPGRNAGPQDD